MDFGDDYFIEEVTTTQYRCLKIRDKIFVGTSEFQRIEVVDTHDYGRALILDGAVQATERDTFIYHEVLVHPPLLMLDEPTAALVIGGGDGGILAELFKHRAIDRVVLVEIDETVIDVSRKHLPSICGAAFEDPRLELHVADGREFIERSDDVFDLIVLDLTDPIGASSSLYTREAYEQLSRLLGSKGILATHAGGWFDYPKVTSTIVSTLRSVFSRVAAFPVHVPSYGMELSFVYASQSVEFASIAGETFAARYAALSEESELKYVGADFTGRLAFQPVLLARCLRSSDRVSTDDDPLLFTDYYSWPRPAV